MSLKINLPASFQSRPSTSHAGYLPLPALSQVPISRLAPRPKHLAILLPTLILLFYYFNTPSDSFDSFPHSPFLSEPPSYHGLSGEVYDQLFDYANSSHTQVYGEHIPIYDPRPRPDPPLPPTFGNPWPRKTIIAKKWLADDTFGIDLEGRGKVGIDPAPPNWPPEEEVRWLYEGAMKALSSVSKETNFKEKRQQGEEGNRRPQNGVVPPVKPVPKGSFANVPIEPGNAVLGNGRPLYRPLRLPLPKEPQIDPQTLRPIPLERSNPWNAPSMESMSAKLTNVNSKDHANVNMEKLPKVQWEGFGEEGWETAAQKNERETRRDWVKKAFGHAWAGYKKHAWGHDELAPVSNGFKDPFNGWGATIVDTLDTLLIMNLTHEYALARTHISQIDFTLLAGSSSAYGALSATAPTLPLFETSIRYLGGLLAAYDLSHDKLMLERAQELADWILPAFDTLSGLPVPRYRIGSDPQGGAVGRVVLSEVGTMSMEFARLSILTGDEKYWSAIKRGADFLEQNFTMSLERKGSLLPTYIVPERPEAVTGTYSLGAQGDSYYEYLIKTHQLLGGTDRQFARMYQNAIQSVWDYLIQPVSVVPGKKLLTIGQLTWTRFSAELEHLTCFAGGMMGLGAKLLGRPKDLLGGQAFTDTCVWAYKMTKSGVGPDSLTFWPNNDDKRFSILKDPNGNEFLQTKGYPAGVLRFDRRYMGRPETIESVFYMWRLTGDRLWMDMGWRMFVSYVEHCMTDSGFAGLANVDVIPAPQSDSMESFVFAETLKYYYLLFTDPNHISLDDFVFNTEAHPLRILKSQSEQEPPLLWTGPKPELEAKYSPPYFKDALQGFENDPSYTTLHRGQGTALQQEYRIKNLKKYKLGFIQEKIDRWREKFGS